MEQQNKASLIFTYILIGLFILAIIGCIIFIATKDLTTKETGLLSILLTIISIVATWVVSNIFASVAHKRAIAEVKEQHLNNLKTYALNAAEKVDNLSNELSRLSVYLQEELEKDEDESSELSKTERIESAIHIVNTLKSVNDTSLSDWKGVIGEELDEIREEKIERENELIEVVDRIENVIKFLTNVQNKQAHAQAEQINDLRKELSLALTSMGGSIIKPKRPKSNRYDVEKECPNCGNLLKYSQKSKPTSYKTVKCPSCEKRSLARWNADKGFILEPEELKKELIKCPHCQQDTEVNISNIPFTKSTSTCSYCQEKINVTRKIDGINIGGSTPIISGYRLKDMDDNKLLKIVKEKLPKQPWPTGIHKKIAEEIGVANHRVNWAISKLISQGDFRPQIDGVVYYRKEDLKDSNNL